MRATAVIAVLAASAALVGCGAATTSLGGGGTAEPGTSAGPSASATPIDVVPGRPANVCDDNSFGFPLSREGAAETSPPRSRQAVPADFAPVLLITCAIDSRLAPGAGRWMYLLEQHATEGLSSVLAALRATPPPKPDGELVCTADLQTDPWFLLVDAGGRSVLPVIPHDNACGKPMNVGLDRLRLKTVHAEKYRQEATPAQLSTGCSSSWKNEPSMFGRDGQMKDAEAPTTVRGAPTRICVYRSTAGKDGEFVSGAKLDADGAEQIGSLLTAGRGESADCTPADDYAVVLIGQDWIYVELSGCERMVVDGGATYTASAPRLVQAIKALDLVS